MESFRHLVTICVTCKFESSVVLYGIVSVSFPVLLLPLFESSVVLYGIVSDCS